MADIDETIAYIQSTLDGGAAWVHRAHVEALLAEITRLRAQGEAHDDPEPAAPHRGGRRKAQQ